MQNKVETFSILLYVQVFVSYNIPEDEILTPLVIEKLVAEIKCHPEKF